MIANIVFVCFTRCFVKIQSEFQIKGSVPAKGIIQQSCSGEEGYSIENVKNITFSLLGKQAGNTKHLI